jgi:hypothetical protein
MTRREKALKLLESLPFPERRVRVGNKGMTRLGPKLWKILFLYSESEATSESGVRRAVKKEFIKALKKGIQCSES